MCNNPKSSFSLVDAHRLSTGPSVFPYNKCISIQYHGRETTPGTTFPLTLEPKEWSQAF